MKEGRREEEEKKKEEGKTRINLQAEETRDSSWLSRDMFGFITNLIKSRGWWPERIHPSRQGP